jgi:2-amino-4-hydroxy-6-hydroxymethyldihydropteridine diphosphokinase
MRSASSFGNWSMPRSTEESSRVTAFIGLGANLGDARATLSEAFKALADLPATELIKISSIYRSAPVDSSGPDYMNAVAKLCTALTPHALLDELHRIERAHDRKRPYRNAPRTLDLDLLLFGEQHIDCATLTVPHSRLHERAFVLLPLAQIEPELTIPGRGRVQELLGSVAGQRVDKLGLDHG